MSKIKLWLTRNFSACPPLSNIRPVFVPKQNYKHLCASQMTSVMLMLAKMSSSTNTSGIILSISSAHSQDRATITEWVAEVLNWWRAGLCTTCTVAATHINDGKVKPREVYIVCQLNMRDVRPNVLHFLICSSVSKLPMSTPYDLLKVRLILSRNSLCDCTNLYGWILRTGWSTSGMVRFTPTRTVGNENGWSMISVEQVSVT